MVIDFYVAAALCLSGLKKREPQKAIFAKMIFHGENKQFHAKQSNFRTCFACHLQKIGLNSGQWNTIPSPLNFN